MPFTPISHNYTHHFPIHSPRLLSSSYLINRMFTTKATHFITLFPKRTEKYLGAVTLGMWILQPSYLEECKKAGRWIDEESFEWRETVPNSKIDGASIRRLREEGGKIFNGARYVRSFLR